MTRLTTSGEVTASKPEEFCQVGKVHHGWILTKAVFNYDYSVVCPLV